MNRANQSALMQETNIGLLEIRRSELEYHISINEAFGIQAALLTGFTYNVFARHERNEDYEYDSGIQDVYWVFSSATIACAIHVIITTMALQVLGPGLALNGPIGSITRANEHMRKEQRYVVLSYILMIVLFSISTTLSFWFIFNVYSAIVSTILLAIAVRQWYFYCERIYLRFFWEDTDSRWNERESEALSPAEIFERNPMHENQSKRTIGLEKLAKKRSLWRGLFQKRTSLEKKLPAAKSPTRVVLESYLQKKNPAGRGDIWDRYYVVLRGTGEFSLYRSRQDYNKRPEQTTNTTPILLDDYKVVIFNSRTESVGNSQNAAVYQMTLVARNEGQGGESHIVFRADTEEDLEIWGLTMREISPQSFQEKESL